MPRPVWERIPERIAPPCALCGGREVVPVAATDMFDSGLGTVLCTGCGLLFTSPRLPSGAYGEFYREDYRRLYLYEQTNRLDDGYLRLRGEFEAADWRWRRYRGILGDAPRLLDAGAGLATTSGVIGERLPAATVTAVEPDPKFADFARQRWGITVVEGSMEQAALPPRSFTHILLLHVLEHVEEPAPFLIGLNRLLPAGGHLLVEVPNIAGPWRGIGMLHPAHLTQFTPDTLRLMLERAGFEAGDIVAWDEGPLALSMSAIAVKRSEPDQPITVPVTPPDVPAVRALFRTRLQGAGRAIRMGKVKRRIAAVLGPSNIGRARRIAHRLGIAGR